MKYLQLALASLLILGLTAAPLGRLVLADGLYFDDSAPDIMILGNDRYEIALSKWNGAIRSITDKATGQHVLDGSDCVWGAVFYDQTTDYEGGCLYGASANKRFAYAWNAASSQLTLTYTGDPGSSYRVNVQVVITASPQSWLDMQMTVDNRWRYELDDVIFPSHLKLARADLREALVPTLPGVMLTEPFFNAGRSYIADYPNLFADFLWASSTKGRLGLYSLYEGAQIKPVSIGYFSFTDHLETVLLDHSFHAKVPVGQTWRSPKVRLRVGQDLTSLISGYRSDNGLDAFPSLRAKLGARYGQVVQSPILKLGMTDFLPRRFAEFPNLLADLPAPAILHLVSYWQHGFDENYPDLLPPDPRLGTTADFAAMVRTLQVRDFLTMPYSNPTWWDDESPTFRQLNPANVVLYEAPGVPRYECYTLSATPPACSVENARRDSAFNLSHPYAMLHGGYAVSPWAPLVKERLDQQVVELTEQVPNDILFQDQIGARSNYTDYGSFAPGATSYAQGWLEHTRGLSGKLLMTEGGFDRLAETEIGFNGGLLLDEITGEAERRWGDRAGWHVFPFATMLVRDKALFYQHNLAPASMTASKQVLSWNASQGFMLTYNLTETAYGGGLQSSWLAVVNAFQKYVFARYADARVTGYERLSNTVTRTVFDGFTVTTNWDMAQSLAVGAHHLAPSGMLVASSDGTLIAGIFTSYNGAPLSSGDHYLIEERGANEIVVRQPMGGDTTLLIRPLPGWGGSPKVQVWAHGTSGQPIQRVTATTSVQGVSFVYRQQVAGRKVSYYRLAEFNASYLPVLLHSR